MIFLLQWIEILEGCALFVSKYLSVLLLWGLLCPLSVSAQEPIKSFAGATLVAESPLQQEYYRLALGPQKKIDNVWRAEKLQNLNVGVRRLTQEVPADFTLAEVLDIYGQMLGLADAQLLYACDGRDCGSSNSWANNHFKIKQLYGLDQSQSYRAYQQAENKWWVLYVVRRGNKRVYVQVEQLTAS